MIRFIVVFLALTIFASIETLSGNSQACKFGRQTRCRPCYRPTENPNDKIINKSPNVSEVELDKAELALPLPVGSPPTHVDYSPEMSVRVATIAADPENDVLTYNYTVSGGRIVGAGSKVLWDLNNVMPGTYTITAGVDDGCGVCGKTVTKTITVLENENAPKCVCSKINIYPLHAIVTTSERIFQVNLTGPQRPGLTFNWKISEGTIISGQGTRAIKVDPSGDSRGRPLTVTVEVGGLDSDCECPTTATGTLSY